MIGLGDLGWKPLLILGGVLVIAGVVLPFLMVVQVLPSTFLLNFFAYISSVTGMWLGMLGAVQLFITRKR